MEFRILGPVEVWSRGRRIEINAQKRRTVLALLLLDINRVVSVDRITEALWLDQPPSRARNAIQGHVSALRQLLTREGAAALGVALRTLQPGYVLEADPDRLDAHRFRQLCADARMADDRRACELYTEAMRLWRGEPMADISPGVELGAALEDARFAAAEEYAAARLRLGEHHAVAADLPALVAEQPLRERLVSQLMMALARAGRQGEAIDLYHRTRARLVEHLGVDPGSDLTEAYRLVLHGDTGAGQAVTAAPPAPRPDHPITPVVPVPAQLPADVRHFTARADELAAIHALASGQSSGWCPSAVVTAVGGAAGIGKSALAVHAAHSLAGEFPDGQLFVDLQGFAETKPLDPAEVLARFLTALGAAPGSIPAGMDERAALYRTLLAGRRVLVVLDNACSSEQVRPLLPGSPTCFVLVTSRNRLDGLVVREGATLLPLGVLSQDDAIALITQMLGAQPTGTDGLTDQAAVRRLVECCDRLPLALRLAAARLAATSTSSIAEFVRELEDEQRRLDTLAVEGGSMAVRSAFALSYRALPAAAARLFRLLGAHPGPDFTVPLAAALSGIGGDKAHDLMATLVAANLVQTTMPGRYVFHDLVRLYARHCFDTDETPAAQELAVHRVVNYYLHEAYACHDVLRPTTPLPEQHTDHPPMPFTATSPAEALSWLDAERANLRLITALALHRGLPQLSWRLAEAQWPVFELRCRYDDAAAVYAIGLEAARTCKDQIGENHLLHRLGSLYRAMGQPDKALQLCEAALVVAATTHDHDIRCATLNTIGIVHGSAARWDDAVRCFERSLTIARTHQLHLREQSALGNLGCLAIMRRRFHDAVEYIDQSLETYRRYGLTEGLSILLNNYGHACRELGRYDEALAHHREGLAISRREGRRMSEAEALDGIGLILHATEGLDAARPYWEAAYALYRELRPSYATEIAARLAGASPSRTDSELVQPAR